MNIICITSVKFLFELVELVRNEMKATFILEISSCFCIWYLVVLWCLSQCYVVMVVFDVAYMFPPRPIIPTVPASPRLHHVPHEPYSTWLMLRFRSDLVNVFFMILYIPFVVGCSKNLIEICHNPGISWNCHLYLTSSGPYWKKCVDNCITFVWRHVEAKSREVTVRGPPFIEVLSGRTGGQFIKQMKVNEICH